MSQNAFLLMAAVQGESGITAAGWAAWHFWVLLSLALAFVEMYTTTFVIGCFSFGAIVAAVASVFVHDPTEWIAAFALGSFIAFVSMRPLFLKFVHRRGDTPRSNIHRLDGATATVIETIASAMRTGKVDVSGQTWGARSEDEGVIEVGTRVQILRVEGNKVVVCPIRD